MEISEAVAALGALAQASRLAAFRLLVQAGPAGLPAGEIAAGVGMPAPTASFHLATLARARLVRSRREGRSVRYAADFDGVRALLAFLIEDCCRGDARCRPPAAES